MLKLIILAALTLAAQDKPEAAKPAPKPEAPKRVQLTADEIKDHQIFEQGYQIWRFRVCERAEIKSDVCIVDPRAGVAYERPSPKAEVKK